MGPGPIACGNDVDPLAQPIGIPKIGVTRRDRRFLFYGYKTQPIISSVCNIIFFHLENKMKTTDCPD